MPSDIAQLKQRITEEYTAAQRGLTGLSAGNTRHEFITARMNNLGAIHEQLVALVGPDEAVKVIVEAVWSPADRRNVAVNEMSGKGGDSA